MSDKNDSTKKALERYYAKQIPKPRRHNAKPEKEVERDCMAWMNSMGWSMGVYEAKNTYNPRSGRWIGKSMRSGTVDCQGVLPNGTFAAVEFKAPTRLSTFNSNRNMK